jgi:hypothetical protein
LKLSSHAKIDIIIFAFLPHLIGSLIDSPKPELGQASGRSAQQRPTKKHGAVGASQKIKKKAPKTTPCATAQEQPDKP